MMPTARQEARILIKRLGGKWRFKGSVSNCSWSIAQNPLTLVCVNKWKPSYYATFNSPSMLIMGPYRATPEGALRIIQSMAHRQHIKDYRTLILMDEIILSQKGR
jgi:hypothetical protein